MISICKTSLLNWSPKAVDVCDFKLADHSKHVWFSNFPFSIISTNYSDFHKTNKIAYIILSLHIYKNVENPGWPIEQLLSCVYFMKFSISITIKPCTPKLFVPPKTKFKGLYRSHHIVDWFLEWLALSKPR